MTRLFVAGTDTGVGKTLVAAGLAMELARRGRNVGVFKPIETGVAVEGEPDPESDAELLRWSSHANWPSSLVCPLRFPDPMAPSVAAARVGTTIDLDDIDRSFGELADSSDDLIVEGCGGLLVPINQNTLVVDLIARWQLPMLLVARAGLGTINHTGLSLEAARARGIEIRGVILSGTQSNSDDPTYSTNARVIEQTFGVEVVASLPQLSNELPTRNKIERAAELLSPVMERCIA